MQKLGYVISKTRLRGVADFIEVSNDPSLFYGDKPALIVGLDLAKNNINNFSIIKKEVVTGKFWTFGKTEKRVDYDKDTKNFYDYVLKSAIANIKYYYVNFFKLNREKIKNLLNIINSKDRKFIYIYRDMLYLYHERYVLGISLKMLKYAGINVNKHLEKIRHNKSIKLTFNDSKLSPYMQQFSKDKKYLIPYFISLLE